MIVLGCKILVYKWPCQRLIDEDVVDYCFVVVVEVVEDLKMI